MRNEIMTDIRIRMLKMGLLNLLQECEDGFICLECSKSFAQKDLKKRKGFMRKKGHMLRHIKEVHMSPEQYECPPCRLIFKNREAIQ